MSETDRRLKDELNANMAMRERMCLELLATQKDFTNVRPRLPKGGPDGGRDIEALYQQCRRAIGAVGFVNDAADSAEHRRSARKKFRDDLKRFSSIPPDEHNRTPAVFVWFTNVGLTPAIIGDLKKAAYGAKAAVCEVFDRERLRIALDCNTGYAIRQRYLNIPLSEAEQSDFFAQWGDQLQEIMSRSFSDLESMTQRLHFLAESQFPVDKITLVAKLSSPIGNIASGNFLFQVMVMLNPHSDGLHSIVFGSGSEPIVESIAEARSSRERFPANTQRGYGFASLLPETTQYDRFREILVAENTDEEEQLLAAGESHGVLELDRSFIFANYGSEPFVERFYPTCRLIDLHRSMVLFDCNAELADHIEEISLIANQYRVLQLRRGDWRIEPGAIERFKLPEKLKHLGDLKDWSTLRPNTISSSFMPNFNTRTPERWLSLEKNSTEQ